MMATDTFGNPFATRMLPGAYGSNEIVRVVLSTLPSAETTVHALEETIPPGWSFVSART